MKTFNIISADIITKAGTEPFVGLTVNVNGKQEQIARTCKQALLDLHKSARGANIPSGLYDNGVEKAHPLLHNQFRNAIIGLVGKVGTADVEFYEAGAEYIASEVSSAVKNGEAKVGDVLFTEKKGSRVEGFMSFPLTAEEQIIEQMVANNANAILDRIFGVVKPVVALPEPTNRKGLDIVENDEELKAIRDKENAEAFGPFTPEDFDTVVPATESAKATTKATK